MKLLIVFICLVMAVSSEESFFPDYHLQYGIPKMARIKAAESAVDFDNSRIIGGLPVYHRRERDFGGLLVYLSDGQVSVCGSSLISNTRLVTAAHCWKGPQTTAISFTVVLGTVTLSTGGVRIDTNDVVMHPDYNVNNRNNDIAVIRIRHVDFNLGVISPVILQETTGDLVGRLATITGYGAVDESEGPTNFLRRADVIVTDNDSCASYYGPSVVTTSTICTSPGRVNPVSPCTGDSGSPLTHFIGRGHLLIGIVSFHSAVSCAAAPAGYTRVSSFVPWIRAQ